MIRILLDQNIHWKIEGWLRLKLGEKADVTSTRTLGMQRMKDDEIFDFCQENKMVIVTFDDDFQNPLEMEGSPGYGVIRLNIYPTGLPQTRKALQRLINYLPTDKWEHASIIIDAEKIRYRTKES